MVYFEKRSSSKLFNNPVLSDVKLKQVYNGQVREYYAHNSALCLESEYFLNAFTGGFKEASEAIMELHEDIPEHFEYMLKSLYNGGYDVNEIFELNDGDKIEAVSIAIGVCVVADKYDVPKIFESAQENVKEILLDYPKDTALLFGAIKSYYGNDNPAGRPMSYLIPSMIFEEYSKHLDRETYEKLFKSDDFEKLLSLYPAFGADIAQALQTKDKLCMGHLCKAWCEVCKEDLVTDVAHMRKQG